MKHNKLSFLQGGAVVFLSISVAYVIHEIFPIIDIGKLSIIFLIVFFLFRLIFMLSSKRIRESREMPTRDHKDINKTIKIRRPLDGAIGGPVITAILAYILFYPEMIGLSLADAPTPEIYLIVFLTFLPGVLGGCAMINCRTSIELTRNEIKIFRPKRSRKTIHLSDINDLFVPPKDPTPISYEPDSCEPDLLIIHLSISGAAEEINLAGLNRSADDFAADISMRIEALNDNRA
ncbi:hypothetical protein [Uliginosibacterium sp. TH139]|uniref:hypothetical protein n=1 Tax=Uliginosibacterium sp. TH139 TaxID=2067453 RepID=UPI0011812154|nr:hypothetical protein [Uliginosibacterium sp. TH139]